jgi:hypothetical protein
MSAITSKTQKRIFAPCMKVLSTTPNPNRPAIKAIMSKPIASRNIFKISFEYERANESEFDYVRPVPCSVWGNSLRGAGGGLPLPGALGPTPARICSHTSQRWTGTSLSISKPNRTCPPLISSTVTLSKRSKPVDPPTTTASRFFLDKTNNVELLSKMDRIVPNIFRIRPCPKAEPACRRPLGEPGQTTTDYAKLPGHRAW